MQVRILGWQYKNIRGLREAVVDLGDDPPRWTFIQMPNGTGKTTTLTLMRVALSGEELSESAVRSFRPDDLADSGEFQLRLSIDEDRCWLFVRLDYETGLISRFTSRAASEAGGFEPGRHLKHGLEQLLTPAFTRLFVFDGELAKSIRDISRDTAAQAIHTLYRLDRLSAVRTTSQRLLQQEQEARATTERGRGNLQGRYNTAKSILTSLGSRKAQLDAEILVARETVSRLRSKKSDRISLDSESRRQMDEATAHRNDVEARISALAKDVLSASRNPATLSEEVHARLSGLGSRLQQLKLPKTTSAEFFSELAAASACICGRPIGPQERDAIRSRASDYLAENEMGVINAMKHALRRSVGDSNELGDMIGVLSKAMRERKELDHRIAQIEVDRERAGDHELETLNARLSDAVGDLERAEQEHRHLTATTRVEQQQFAASWKSNIPLCEAEVDDKRRQLAAATRTLRLLQQSEFVRKLLADVEACASAKLRERVQEATNAKLSTLLPGEQLRVSRIGKSLELRSKNLRTKDAVSEGQSLAVAYAFLTSLFEAAPYRFPFIVDSPAVSLDTRVRREVAELVPSLFHQVVFLVLSSEREGFADSFYGREGARFLTIETDASGETRIARGVDDFRSFHSESEETSEAST